VSATTPTCLRWGISHIPTQVTLSSEISAGDRTFSGSVVPGRAQVGDRHRTRNRSGWSDKPPTKTERCVRRSAIGRKPENICSLRDLPVLTLNRHAFDGCRACRRRYLVIGLCADSASVAVRMLIAERRPASGSPASIVNDYGDGSSCHGSRVSEMRYRFRSCPRKASVPSLHPNSTGNDRAVGRHLTHQTNLLSVCTSVRRRARRYITHRR
jgi:hypothetical protein